MASVHYPRPIQRTQSHVATQPHPHDIVFQQMVLRTAQALPSPPPSLPLATVQLSVNIAGRKGQIISKSAPRRRDETDDEGYYADRDNAPSQVLDQPPAGSSTKKPLARASVSSVSKARCQLCRSDIPPLSYRLRIIDPSTTLPTPYRNTVFHITCFEDSFDLEQPGAFSRIYPAPSPSPNNDTPPRSWLDGGARAIVNAWKLQRRRDGLEGAAGPDSGIRISPISPCCDSPPVVPRKVGDKRRSVEAELEDERKRAKYYTSDDGYGRATDILLRKGISIGTRRPIHPNRPAHLLRHGPGTPSLHNLPLKLSDALKRLDGFT